MLRLLRSSSMVYGPVAVGEPVGLGAGRCDGASCFGLALRDGYPDASRSISFCRRSLAHKSLMVSGPL